VPAGAQLRPGVARLGAAARLPQHGRGWRTGRGPAWAGWPWLGGRCRGGPAGHPRARRCRAGAPDSRSQRRRVWAEISAAVRSARLVATNTISLPSGCPARSATSRRMTGRRLACGRPMRTQAVGCLQVPTRTPLTRTTHDPGLEVVSTIKGEGPLSEFIEESGAVADSGRKPVCQKKRSVQKEVDGKTFNTGGT